MKKKTALDLNTLLVILLVLVVAAGLYFTLSVPKPKAPEPTQPALKITATILGNDCEDCFNTTVATDFLAKQTNLNITEIKQLTIQESKELADKYNITRLPAIVLTGEVNNLTIPNFEQKEGALVFANAPPPYYDIATKQYRGKITLTTIDVTCQDCFNMSSLLGQLEQAGVKIDKKTQLLATSEEAKTLISKYKIQKLPTLIMSKEALEYGVINEVWGQVGSEEEDGNLILRFVYPPYVNASTGKTEGLVDLTLLTDKTCTDCLNTTVYEELFKQGLNMRTKTITNVDVSSAKGKLLIKKYNITIVPTLIASKDAAQYPVMAEVWQQLGSIEKDGSYVLRNVQLMERAVGSPITYKNLTSGETQLSSQPKEEADISAPEAEED
ncbi:hypothetical protein HY489_02710 [Candidatus Woesearchaeota archaeon]|nr:hypothetical protein [Candidatus Woesearchaeota archaeon]